MASASSAAAQDAEQVSVPLEENRVRVEVFEAVQEVQFANLDGLAVIEGDIVIGSVNEIQDAATADTLEPFGLFIRGDSRRWPNGIIPYRLEPGLASPANVETAIAHWRDKTNLNFRPATAQDNDLIVFRPAGPSGGCNSFVGRIGGEQPINLSPNCSLGNVIHEIGHAIGFGHEHMRSDRGRYVAVLFSNIDDSFEGNFQINTLRYKDQGEYCYGSIFHYPRLAFSTNNKDTIVPIKIVKGAAVAAPEIKIGQRDGLAPCDIAVANAMYQ